MGKRDDDSARERSMGRLGLNGTMVAMLASTATALALFALLIWLDPIRRF